MSTSDELKLSMIDSLCQTAATHASLNQHEAAIDYYQQSLALSRQLQDASLEDRILPELGAVYVKAGEPDTAIEHLQKGLGALRKMAGAEPMRIARYLQVLVDADEAAGRLTKAAESLQEVIAIYDSQRCDITDQIQLNLRHADLYMRADDCLTASIPYQRAVGLAQQASNPALEAQGLYGLGLVCLRQNQIENGKRYMESVIEVARKNNDIQLQGMAYHQLGSAYLAANRPGDAINCLQRASGLLSASGDANVHALIEAELQSAYPVVVANASAGEIEKQIEKARAANQLSILPALLAELASRYYEQGQFHKVVESYDNAVTISQEAGDRYGEMTWLTYLGNFYAGRYESYKALQVYEAALAISREVRDQLSEGQLLLNLGLTYADQERLNDAKKLLKEAQRIFEQLGEAELVAQTRKHLNALG